MESPKKWQVYCMADHVDAQAAERASVLGAVTDSKFSAVAQPSARGTCGSGHQSLEQVDPPTPHPGAKHSQSNSADRRVTRLLLRCFCVSLSSEGGF